MCEVEGREDENDEVAEQTDGISCEGESDEADRRPALRRPSVGVGDDDPARQERRVFDPDEGPAVDEVELTDGTARVMDGIRNDSLRCGAGVKAAGSRQERMREEAGTGGKEGEEGSTWGVAPRMLKAGERGERLRGSELDSERSDSERRRCSRSSRSCGLGRENDRGRDLWQSSEKASQLGWSGWAEGQEGPTPCGWRPCGGQLPSQDGARPPQSQHCQT